MGVSNDQIYAELLNINKAMGRVEAACQANAEHTTAVSLKADKVRSDCMAEIRGLGDKLDQHAGEQGAHGVAVEKRAWSDARALLFSLVGAAVGAITILKFLAPLAKAGGN
jgi:hypothetical protein